MTLRRDELFPFSAPVGDIREDIITHPASFYGDVPPIEPPANIVAPVITGTFRVGETLSCSTGTWSGSPTYSYAWQRDGTPIGSATMNSYELVEDDEGAVVTCIVTATNDAGSTNEEAEGEEVLPALAPPVNITPPEITGTFVVGEILSVSDGTWSGSPTYTYQWLRDGDSISGATNDTYELVEDDEGFVVSCLVTATNPDGSANEEAEGEEVLPAPSLMRQLFAWGDGSSGLLANGIHNRTYHLSSPLQITDPSVSFNKAFCRDGNEGAFVLSGTDLYAWGQLTFGQGGNGVATQLLSSPTQIAGSWLDIAPGLSVSGNSWHILGLKSDGTLWVWGQNSNGKLGDAGVANRSSPFQLGALSYTAIGAGAAHSGAISGGALYMWGAATGGMLGNGTTTPNISSPVQIGTLTDWATVSCGLSYTLATKTDGTLWAWGAGTVGQLGDGTAVAKSSPVQIGTLTNWARVIAGKSFSIALKTDSTLWTWGNNGSGQLGVGDTTVRSSPVQVPGSWIDCACWGTSAGTMRVSGIKSDGTLWTWGSNTEKQYVDSIVNYSSPVQIGTKSNYVQIVGYASGIIAIDSAGDLFVGGARMPGLMPYDVNVNSPIQIAGDWEDVYIKKAGIAHGKKLDDGTLYSWGNNDTGSSGAGVFSYFLGTPTSVPVISPFVDADFTALGNGTNAIIYDGILTSWGTNNNGQTGIGGTQTIYSPVQVGTVNTWASVAIAPLANMHAIRADGTLWGAGINGGGQVGDGTTTQRDTLVQIGTLTNWAEVHHGFSWTLAKKTDGTLWAWGVGTSGQLGDGTAVSKSSPVQVGTDTDWAQVSVGNSATVAIKTNGTLWAWGIGTAGQIGNGVAASVSVPTQIGTLTNWAKVYAHNNSMFAINDDGELFGWGLNTVAQLGVLDNVNKSSPVQIGTGKTFLDVRLGNQVNIATIALATNGTLWSWGDGSNGSLGTTDFDIENSPVQIGSHTDWVEIFSSSSGTNFGIREISA